jgi:ADP-ribosylglycohydrolase
MQRSRQFDELVRASIFGFAVGDALGVPFEFSSREDRKQQPVTLMVGGGYWKQPIGTWSDDTSLILCTIESLCKGYDIADIGKTFHQWLYQHRFTPHGKVFDKGNQILFAIERIDFILKLKDPIMPMHKSDVTSKDNGNGSLMRILPLAFFLCHKPLDEHFQIIRDVSSLTHPHDRSVVACFIYVEFAIALIQGQTKEMAMKHIKKMVPSYMPGNIRASEVKLFARILENDIESLSENLIKSNGYVINSLEASLWCLMNGNNYRETVSKAVNLGGDTDTNAALAGGLAGLVYGYQSIPEEWLKVLVKKDEISSMCHSFSEAMQ